MYFNNLIGRLTYGKELLNFRKNSHFCKTNHPGFAASVRHPSPLAKTDGKPAKRIVCSLGLNVPEPVSLRTKESCSIPRKTTLFPKRISPLPPRSSPYALHVFARHSSAEGCRSNLGGGCLYCPNPEILFRAQRQSLTPVAYVDDEWTPTKQYRFNPNGSPFGITAFCSPDGRHLAMMPHPERSFLLWRWPWIPQEWKTQKWQADVGDHHLWASPWLRLFQNAREWCAHQVS